jgi:hypothetical protein
MASLQGVDGRDKHGHDGVRGHVPKSCSSVFADRRSWKQMMLTALLLIGTGGAASADDVNDYPTAARAEYVFGCMKANGESRQSLDRCSCSADVIASLLPYERYVTAETVLSMAQVQGNLGGQFRSSEQANSALNELRRAQAEAEVRCF